MSVLSRTSEHVSADTGANAQKRDKSEAARRASIVTGQGLGDAKGSESTDSSIQESFGAWSMLALRDDRR